MLSLSPLDEAAPTILHASGWTADEKLAAALAEQVGLPYMDLRVAEIEPQATRLMPEPLQRELALLPIKVAANGAVLVACSRPPERDVVDAVERFLRRSVSPVLVTETGLEEAFYRVYRDAYLQIAVGRLAKVSPRDSAREVLSQRQKRLGLGLLALGTIGVVLVPLVTFSLLFILVISFYVCVMVFRLLLVWRALSGSGEIEIAAEELALLEDQHLPVYTVLVPVYRELEVLPTLVDALNRLDYPKAKLDIRILLEQDDRETIEAARRSNLPGHFKLIVVPPGSPRGKPRACNYGLIHARGEFLVIYDAEDIPEPDQLKKCFLAFRSGGPRLACVQAKLNYFNRDQNFLTRWFTAEYSQLFDLILPGLAASNLPIPLGGTSNHFRVELLSDVGGWDPHNVTEDADLGIRLHKAGLTTKIVNSTTYEEANCDLYNWIRQRSRWVKGYVQTYLVHMRDPLRLIRTIGLKDFVVFQLMFGGTFLVLLINPVLWLGSAGGIFAHRLFADGMLSGWLPTWGAVSLGIFGNLIFLYLNVFGCLRRGYYHLVKYTLLSPIYWLLMSIGAWRGLLQLVHKPSYWEKTRHGLYRPNTSVPPGGFLAGVRPRGGFSIGLAAAASVRASRLCWQTARGSLDLLMLAGLTLAAAAHIWMTPR